MFVALNKRWIFSPFGLPYSRLRICVWWVAGPAQGKEAGARTACKDDRLHGGGAPGECAKTHLLFCGNDLSGFLFAPPADL